MQGRSVRRNSKISTTTEDDLIEKESLINHHNAVRILNPDIIEAKVRKKLILINKIKK